jgi:hypothetical protein
MFKVILKVICVSAVALSISACEEQLIQRNHQTIGGKTSGEDDDRPGGFKDAPGESYPFPTVAEQEFIPAYDLFDDYKCKVWRIEWPWYDDDFDYNLIPGVLSLSTGELRSFNFLNTTEPENTYASTFSLFYADRVEQAGDMWDELEYTFNTPEAMEYVTFVKVNLNLATVQNWVQNRPKLFSSNWTDVGTNSELDYQEGDFIHFKLSNTSLSPTELYGGIRIVSMSPRIIEVYLAMPNP